MPTSVNSENTPRPKRRMRKIVDTPRPVKTLVKCGSVMLFMGLGGGRFCDSFRLVTPRPSLCRNGPFRRKPRFHPALLPRLTIKGRAGSCMFDNNNDSGDSGKKTKNEASEAPGRGPKTEQQANRKRSKNKLTKKGEPHSSFSLLPPPPKRINIDDTDDKDFPRGRPPRIEKSDASPFTSSLLPPLNQSSSTKSKSKSKSDSTEDFPASRRSKRNKPGNKNNGNIGDTKILKQMPSPLDGVLPISELFYQSNPVESREEGCEEEASEGDTIFDDEELPFSAEQSNKLKVTHNKIQVRRNNAKKRNNQGKNRYDNGKRSGRNENSRSRDDNAVGRKMVRRGMEMLVGGEPINADPPLRFLELEYDANTLDWAKTITLNSQDFGPLLHSQSVSKVSPLARGLYCEHIFDRMMHWKICPREMRTLIFKHNKNPKSLLNMTYSSLLQLMTETPLNNEDTEYVNHNNTHTDNTECTEIPHTKGFGPPPKKNRPKNVRKLPQYSKKQKHSSSIDRLQGNTTTTRSTSFTTSEILQGGELKFSIAVSPPLLCNPPGVFERILKTGIGAAIHAEENGFWVDVHHLGVQQDDEMEEMTHVSVEFHLVPVDGGEGKDDSGLLRRVNMIKLALSQAVDQGDISLALASAAKEDRGERSWDTNVRERIVEEFLFEVEEEDEEGIMLEENYDSEDKVEEDRPIDTVGIRMEDTLDKIIATNTIQGLINEASSSLSNAITDEHFSNDYVPDGPFGSLDSPSYSPDDIYLGGGNDGVFFNYSPDNAPKSPFKGSLGPLLLDAVVTRAIQRKPRVIAIGDVHGCLDELQALLRRCDYRPGDLVVFLGDLVCKGPDSLGVVQLAREIGAIGIRGNHDFEVIRWHQAIKSGADPPVIGSEHFHIASGLAKNDLKWLYSLPWYISSPELKALFVHAGFVSGIRLPKQNPRLMMNMRSILPDGTVTSKFFNNWPWARLWDGPQTVFFGHDADRGLQQYEHAIGLDTGCVYGGRLTACILPEKRLVSVSAKKEYFQYRRKHFD